MSTLPENTLPWRPVADTIRLIADTKPATRQTVLILGAGMAGLGAANELAKHDDVAHVHIVEGRKHNACVVGVGGRVMTHRFGSAPEADEADGRPYHELGAMRVPHLTHDYTWHYIRELGLKTREFVNNVTGFYEVQGEKYPNDPGGWKALVAAFGLAGGEAVAVLKFGPGQLLSMAMSLLLARLTRADRILLVNGHLTTPLLRWLDAQTIIAYLMEGLPAGVSGPAIPRPLTPNARALLSATTALESRWHWSLAGDLRSTLTNTPAEMTVPSEEGEEPKKRRVLWEVEGGLDRLPRGLHARLAKNPKVTFHFETEVTRLKLRDDGEVEVGLAQKGQPWTPPFTFDRVICTLPFPVLRQLEPTGLSNAKLRAIRNMQLCSSSKVLLHCKERFWEDQGIHGGSSVTDRAARQAYYPSDFRPAQDLPPPAEALVMAATDTSELVEYWDANSPVGVAERVEPSAASLGADGSRRSGVLLGSYTWSDAARQVGRLAGEEDGPTDASETAAPPESRRERIVEDLAHIHPELSQEGMVLGSASIYWDRFKWSRGAFGSTPPGDLTDYYQDGRRAEGRLFFAGEHISIAPGWIQGALESGLDAAYQLLVHAKQAQDDVSEHAPPLVRHHIDLAAPPLFIRGSKGVLGCGYFDVATFNLTKEAGVVIRCVKSLDDLREKKVVGWQDISERARTLGVAPGMTGQAVLEILR